MRSSYIYGPWKQSWNKINELWDANARSHLVWMIASFFLIFILGSYFLFIEKNRRSFPHTIIRFDVWRFEFFPGYAISALILSH